MSYRIILFLAVFSFHGTLDAQPYIDVVSTFAQWSPDKGLVRRSHNKNVVDRQNVSLNMPFILKDSSIILIGSNLDLWNVGADTVDTVGLTGLGGSATFIKPFNKKWTGVFTLIARWNGNESFQLNNAGQVGGALLLSYKKLPTLKYRFGLYYNKEFFGNFVVPFAGIEWNINSKNIIYGVLPGSLTWEHKMNDRFFYGLNFRAITTSYRNHPASSKQFIRIDDNQLNGFADVYFSKRIVLAVEVGHSLVRQIRMGETGSKIKYTHKNKMNDNLFFKVGMAFRFRTA